MWHHLIAWIQWHPRNARECRWLAWGLDAGFSTGRGRRLLCACNADPTSVFAGNKDRAKKNWGRQNTQSLQAVLAVAPFKKGKQLVNVIHFVCVSVCLCVCVSIALFRCEAESGSKLLLGVRSEPKKTIMAKWNGWPLSAHFSKYILVFWNAE